MRSVAHARRPPGPAGSFLVGNLQAYEQDRLGFLMHVRREYGAVVSFDSRTTIVNDAALADCILRDQSGAFEVTQNFLGQQLSPAKLASVLQVRRLLNPGLRPNTLHQVPRDIASLVSRSLDVADGRAFDPVAFGERVIAEAFSWRLFGDGQAPFVQRVAQLLDSLEQVIGNVFAPPARWRSLTQRRIEAQHAELRFRIVAYLAHRSRAGEWQEGSLVEDMLRYGRDHQPELLADLLIGAMLAAQRVPAAGAGWVLMMLADRPGLQSSLLQESAHFMRLVESDQAIAVTQFPLTLAAVLETLRLYPPTWLITRTSMRDATLGGFRFRAGHVFMISPYVLHRDPSLYEQAETYMPERWLGATPPPITFLSFGRGLHKCPGSDLSTTSLVAIVLAILADHVIRRSGDVCPDPRNTLRPSGLQIHLHGRESAPPGRPCVTVARP